MQLSEVAKQKVGISPDDKVQCILVEGQYLSILYVM
jgi:hypothetical protein